MIAHRPAATAPPQDSDSAAATTATNPDERWAASRPLAPVFAGLAVALVSAGLWWALRTDDTIWAGSNLAAWAVLATGLILSAVVVVALTVLADRVRLQEDLAYERSRLSVDPLTGLLNRRGITDELTRRLDEAEPGELIGVQFCDPDRLRLVNDSLGHGAGDQVLGVLARRLARLVRDGDALGRFGSDGFVVVTSGLPTVRDLEILGSRVVDASRQPVGLKGGSSPVVTSSVGVAWTTTHDTTAEILIRDAAAALTKAKRAGGGRVVLFDGGLRAEAVDRLQIEHDLRRAIIEGALDVHYQPIVPLVDGGTDEFPGPAFEALVRWDHPTRGAMRPAEFLPVAAESLLIVELGELVLTEACRRAARWSELGGEPVSVAVNVSERQLLDLNLIDVVTRALAISGLPAAQLELEVTEELILERFEHSVTVLRQLDLMGVRLAIDDFGTSQASLSRLKEVAMVSTLKIDRSFIANVAVDPVDTRIVAAIVALASSVGLSVVAEGVETEAQAMVLRKLGVGYGQGYLFGRPAPAGAIEQQLVGADAGAVSDGDQLAGGVPSAEATPAELR